MQTARPYDPCWHPDVAEYKRELDDPANMPEIRKRAQRMLDHWETRQTAERDLTKRLEAFRAYERDPRYRESMDPLLIDRSAVEMAALLVHARPQTRVWFQPIHDETVVIARRTRHLRQAILLAQSFPVLDVDERPGRPSALGISC